MSTPAFVILIVCFASLALAEDFKTINGKEYKNVTVSRVEPDGLMLKSKSGISKVYFSELPKEVIDKWLPPEQKQRIAAQKAAEEKRIQEQIAAEREKQKNAEAAERERAEKQKNAEAAEREREKRAKTAEADLKQLLEKFQVAEQRSAQAYQSATKGTLSGQVFVSTKGGANFKLGAVEVALFARDAIDVLLAGLKTNADIEIQ
jgi:type IV secretory pathway VirB10-like protein